MENKKLYHIENMIISNNILSLRVDGQDYNINLEKVSKRLFEAKKNEQDTFKISPSGYGIHWPLIDEDLSINSLILNKA